MKKVHSLLLSAAFLNGLSCSIGRTPPDTHRLVIPALDFPVTVDGRLDERGYQRAPLVSDFVIAGEANRRPAQTRAWMFWNDDQLVVAFDCDDGSLVAATSTGRERDVDPQDRVELFLWSGRPEDAYYCIEVSARGAVHDYRARFYRQFDDGWTPAGMKTAVRERAGGYRVELLIPKAGLNAAGFRLERGQVWRAGLFRADFSPGRPDAPDWITWVDARTPQPDFHVAGAFGTVVLGRWRAAR